MRNADESEKKMSRYTVTMEVEAPSYATAEALVQGVRVPDTQLWIEHHD
jgi:hypothetical protein